MRVALLTLIAIFAAGGPGVAGDYAVGRPTSDQNEMSCNVAKVYRLPSGRRLAVTRGHASRSPTRDHLPQGKVVYTCDGWGRSWTKIYYAAPGRPCRPASTDGIKFKAARAPGNCRSGWAPTRYLNIISG